MVYHRVQLILEKNTHEVYGMITQLLRLVYQTWPMAETPLSVRPHRE